MRNKIRNMPDEMVNDALDVLADGFDDVAYVLLYPGTETKDVIMRARRKYLDMLQDLEEFEMERMVRLE
jgi:hypothetical protein